MTHFDMGISEAENGRFGEIWQTLSCLDIGDKIVEKPGTGNPSYLSWGDGWGLLMQHYPGAKFKFHRSDKRYEGDEVFEALDGSAEVRCTVSIIGCSREMWLPVMDHKFNAIVDPDAREVSDAKMRCLVKCLALFGLGHSLYAKAKEDVPDESRTPRDRGASRGNSRGGAKGTGRGQDTRSRPSQQSKPLGDKISDETALALIREATSLGQLEDRYDDQVAEAKKRGDQPLLDKLFAEYDRRAGELERK
jgi:hypothetical protein